MSTIMAQVVGMDGRSVPAVLRDSQLGTGSSLSSYKITTITGPSPYKIIITSPPWHHDFHGAMGDILVLQFGTC